MAPLCAPGPCTRGYLWWVPCLVSGVGQAGEGECWTLLLLSARGLPPPSAKQPKHRLQWWSSPRLFPKANFDFADTKAGLCPCLGRARRGPGLALCAPGSRSRRWAGGVAAQCQHCLWPPRLPWGTGGGCPPCCCSGSPAPQEPGTAWGHRPAVLTPSVPDGPLAPAGTCPLAVPLLRAGRRAHPKSTWSCSDGVAPTSPLPSALLPCG